MFPSDSVPASATAQDRAPEVVPRRAILRGAAIAGVVTGLAITGADQAMAATLGGQPLLCEPYLLDPDEHGVHVVWHTEDQGILQVIIAGHAVTTMTDDEVLSAATGSSNCGPSAGDQSSGDPCDSAPAHGWRRFFATSVLLTRMREDAASQVPGQVYPGVEARTVFRHLTEVHGLETGQSSADRRVPYRVVSIDSGHLATITQLYSLAPALPASAPARLLLTSDHQLKTMTPANLEMVGQTVGTSLDGVLMAGDCVNVPDRASDWFDSTAGLAFFANFTGRASKTIAGRTYHGAPILQHTPIFPSIGNHEVMGRRSTAQPLTAQFNDPQPAEVATRLWEQTQPTGVDRGTWIADHSWDTTSYEQLFPYPRSSEGGSRWYARRVGEVFLISLFVTGIWRAGATTGKGKFQESTESLNDPNAWGFGQFVFEPIKRGSRQYAWLERALRSNEARTARYRVVMFHNSSHGLGDNSAPAFTDPVQALTVDPATGALTSVTYSYPLTADHVLRDVEPLLNAARVNLVLNGHAHLWNRFRNAAGVNWLETSNVGNSYGAFDVSSGASRPLPASPDHVTQGDPGGLTPIVPTIKPLTSASGVPLPYVSSGAITVFSVLDSGTGTVRSYRFDTGAPTSAAELFDEFPLA